MSVSRPRFPSGLGSRFGHRTRQTSSPLAVMKSWSRRRCSRVANGGMQRTASSPWSHSHQQQ